MKWRVLSNVLLAAGVLGLGAAGYGYYLSGDGPGAIVLELDRVLPSLPVGINEWRVQVHNPTRHIVRIVGCSLCCGSSMKTSLPLEIPAGATVDLECAVQVARAGPFESQFCLYFDDLGLRQQVVTLRGTAGP